jgi:hypothetical protein
MLCADPNFTMGLNPIAYSYRSDFQSDKFDHERPIVAPPEDVAEVFVDPKSSTKWTKGAEVHHKLNDRKMPSTNLPYDIYQTILVNRKYLYETHSKPDEEAVKTFERGLGAAEPRYAPPLAFFIDPASSRYLHRVQAALGHGSDANEDDFDQRLETEADLIRKRLLPVFEDEAKSDQTHPIRDNPEVLFGVYQ